MRMDLMSTWLTEISLAALAAAHPGAPSIRLARHARVLIWSLVRPRSDSARTRRCATREADEREVRQLAVALRYDVAVRARMREHDVARAAPRHLGGERGGGLADPDRDLGRSGLDPDVARLVEGP